jgi:hypothetical protein
MFSIQLQWLAFSVNLVMVDAWMKANANSGTYVGNSADTQLTLWFQNDPSADAAAINTYWSGLTNVSTEATSYQTADQIKVAAAAAEASALASATSKLTALGLTDSEIAALRG